MRPSPRPPEINVTPLVDVVLVLLIIFMVVIPQLQSGAAITVPSAHNPDERTEVETEAIAVGVTARGDVFLDRQPIERAALIPALRALMKAQPGRSLRIQGDEEAQYAMVRGLFRDCQAVGFPGVALEVGDVREDDPEGTN